MSYENPNWHEFDETIYNHRFEYFKYFVENKFHDGFWNNIIKREKSSVNYLIAFHTLISNKCATDKETTSYIVYKSLKKKFLKEYNLNEFKNVFEDCFKSHGIKVALPILNLGIKRSFDDFDKLYKSFEIDIFNKGILDGDTVLLKIPTNKKKQFSEKQIIDLTSKFIETLFNDVIKKNSLITSKKIFFKKITNAQTYASDLLLGALFFGVYSSFINNHSVDIEHETKIELESKCAAIISFALRTFLNDNSSNSYEFITNVMSFPLQVPNWEYEEYEGEFYLRKRFELGQKMYDNFYYSYY